jgi:hypothetical protein
MQWGNKMIQASVSFVKHKIDPSTKSGQYKNGINPNAISNLKYIVLSY